MTKIIGIFSGKGGVGKTTSALNLGMALNEFGKDITIVDANLTTPNIGLHLGVPIVPINLHHVLQGKYDISEAVYQHPSGTKIVPASLSLDDLKNTNPSRLKENILNLVGNTDIILLDTAPGLGNESLSALKSVDEVIVVTNPELPAITDSLKTIKLAERLKIPVKGVIVNRTRENGLDISDKNVEALLEKNILAVVPEDNAIRESLVKKDPVIITHPKSPSAIAYKRLAASLLGKKYDEKPEKEKIGFFSKFLKVFGLK